MSRDGMTSQTGMCMHSSREAVCGNNAVQFQSCDDSSYCTVLAEHGSTDIVSYQLWNFCGYQISARSPAEKHQYYKTVRRTYFSSVSVGVCHALQSIVHTILLLIMPYTWHQYYKTVCRTYFSSGITRVSWPLWCLSCTLVQTSVNCPHLCLTILQLIMPYTWKNWRWTSDEDCFWACRNLITTWISQLARNNISAAIFF